MAVDARSCTKNLRFLFTNLIYIQYKMCIYIYVYTHTYVYIYIYICFVSPVYLSIRDRTLYPKKRMVPTKNGCPLQGV